MRNSKAAAEGRPYVLILAALCTALLLGTTFAAPPAQARSVTYNLDIPAQSLKDALQALALASQHKLLYSSELVEGKKSPALKGEFTTEQALKALLSGTQLNYEVTSDGLLLIRASNRPEGMNTVAPLPSGAADRPVQLAQVNATATSTSGAAPVANSNASNTETNSITTGSEKSYLSEIIVTAQKRTERLQDVPVPVTAISAQTLVDNYQLRLQDYYTSVPGLSVAPGNGTQILAIRGITTGPGNPTVGIAIDDVPYGGRDGGGNVVDIDPSDLARVEVLRGPQGTLYGASSMGGLIKFVTLDPSTAGYSGRVELGTVGVDNGAGPGYSFRGSANMPLSNTFAIRASGFTREDPGYIDNPVLHETGVNEAHASGGRLSALWLPSDEFSLKVSALYQKFKSNGVNDVTPGLGDLQQDYTRGTGASDGSIQAYSATLTGKLENVSLTALSGYNITESRTSTDFSSAFGGLTEQLYHVSGASLNTDFETKKFTQEIRLSAPIGRSADWLIGAFYSHESSSELQDVFAIDSTSGSVVADGYHSPQPSTYAEYAAFADLTLHVTDRFDVQIGGRYSSIRQTFQQTTIEPIFSQGSTVPSVGVTTHASASPFTYLLTPSFKVTSDLLLYARVASGYRAGGPNSQLCVMYGFPCQFNPDKTHNYELGTKGDFLNHVLSFDASLYYIDWQNIQLLVSDEPTSVQSYYTNAGQAKSQGVELSIEAKPLTGLTVAAWATWSDAKLTKAFPAASSAYGVAGDSLPYSSRFSGNVSIDQQFPIGSVTGFVGGSVSYLGDRTGSFGGSASTPRQDLPGYARADVRGGVKSGNWTINLFVNNAFDKRGVLEGPLDVIPPAFLYIQPRTVGVNISKTF